MFTILRYSRATVPLYPFKPNACVKYCRDAPTLVRDQMIVFVKLVLSLFSHPKINNNQKRNNINEWITYRTGRSTMKWECEDNGWIDYSMLSMRVSRRLLEMAEGACSPNLKIDSITESSVEVVSRP